MKRKFTIELCLSDYSPHFSDERLQDYICKSLFHRMLTGDDTAVLNNLRVAEVKGNDRPEKVNLFLISRDSSTQNQRDYWTNSTEHGCGWTPGKPKQAFSKTELTKQLTYMIEDGCFQDVLIEELKV